MEISETVALVDEYRSLSAQVVELKAAHAQVTKSEDALLILNIESVSYSSRGVYFKLPKKPLLETLLMAIQEATERIREIQELL